MRGLVGVELTRLRWRRAVLLLGLAAVVLPALVFVVTAWNTRPVDRAELDSILSERYAAREVARCERRPEGFLYPEPPAEVLADPALVTERCRDLVASWYGGRPPLLPEEQLEGSLLAVATIVLLLLVLAGTTFTGHDWNTGSMGNQLLFEPRRARLWTAKLTAVVLCAALLGTAVLAAYWTGLWTLAEARGNTAPPGTVRDGYEQVLRCGALAAAGGALGFALTMLFRSTVATLGVLFAVAVANGALLAVLGDSALRWQPPLNVAAVALGEVTFYDPSVLPEECLGGRVPRGVSCDGERTVTAVDGGLYTGAVVLVVGAASLLSFRRRDVA